MAATIDRPDLTYTCVVYRNDGSLRMVRLAAATLALAARAAASLAKGLQNSGRYELWHAGVLNVDYRPEADLPQLSVANDRAPLPKRAPILKSGHKPMMGVVLPLVADDRLRAALLV